MSSSSIQGPIDSIAEVLGHAHKKGVRLWLEDGQLRYQAPKGVLTRGEIDRLRISKDQIVAFLERTNAGQIADPKLARRPRRDHAPLAFSQLAHWHLYQLGTQRTIRQIASATRLRGRLNIDALQESVSAIVCRHDALRTRVVVHDGVPVQEIAETGHCQLVVDDLTVLPASAREVEVNRRIDQLILEPIDVAVGPLFEVRLLRLRDDEHVLIAVMEHTISDGFSRSILLRDLLTAYMQTSIGRAPSLPAIPIQFADYAFWQRSAQRSWVQKHGAYWNERLAGCCRLRFPADDSLQSATRRGWQTLPLRIDKGLKDRLHDWCRRQQTTLVMSIFTAYVALVLRWCDASEAVIQYQSDGRVSHELENAIGYFANVLYLRIGLREDDGFVDLLNRVTAEYCEAYEHANSSSYIAAQVPAPEFTRNSAFNWLPQGPTTAVPDIGGSGDTITCAPIAFAHPMLRCLEFDHEPSVRLCDVGEEIVGAVHFPMNRFSEDTMERFARNFLVFVTSLLGQPGGRVKDILLL